MSAFGYQNDAIKNGYLCNFVNRDILNTLGYRKFTKERELLKAILDYVNDHLHSMFIKKLEIWRSTIELGMKICDHLRNLR